MFSILENFVLQKQYCNRESELKYYAGVEYFLQLPL